MPGLKEVRRGVFYRRSKAFIHFHDDPSGLYADIRLDKDFERYRVDTEDERLHLLNQIRMVLSPEAGLMPPAGPGGRAGGV